jgi:hypothetical protein
MILVTLVLTMIALIGYGKSIKEFNAKHYAIATLIALLQLSVILYKMFTMEKPPLY